MDKIHDLTKIDKWFLHKLQNLKDTMTEIQGVGSINSMKPELMLKAKKQGFSDKQIALYTKSTEGEVRSRRQKFGIRPWVKKIDTLAAEFPADTNYLYTTYNASTHDVTFEDKGTIILGSGVYRIGSSVEFDWCAVNATLSLRNMGQKTVMINVSNLVLVFSCCAHRVTPSLSMGAGRPYPGRTSGHAYPLDGLMDVPTLWTNLWMDLESTSFVEVASHFESLNS